MVIMHVPVVLRAMLLAPLFLFSSACVATKTTTTSSAAPTENAMSEPTESNTLPANPPSLSPAEIEGRLLKFAESIKGPDDFTFERYKKIMQLPPQSTEPGEVNQDYAEDVPGTNKWVHTLSFSGAPSAQSKRVSYTLDSDELRIGSQALDLSPICGKGFDAFREELLAIGFFEGPSMPVHDYEQHNTFTHTFDRNGIVADVVTAGGGDTGQNACIVSLEVWVRSAHTDKE